MKATFAFVPFMWLCSLALAQDEIVLSNGNSIAAKVTEVGSDFIKYYKWDNQNGPVYSIKKTEVFMIKYQGGSKDVFGTPSTNAESIAPATFYFFRPKKFAGSSPEIIVGTVEPDEVILKLKNGSWYQTDYKNLGQRSFVAGVYAINPEPFILDIEAGKTYYIRCTLLSSGFKMMAQLENVDEATAKSEMSDLKEQKKPK